MATTASDIRTGLILKRVDGDLYTVIEFGQNEQPRAAARFGQIKGLITTKYHRAFTWNSGEAISQ